MIKTISNADYSVPCLTAAYAHRTASLVDNFDVRRSAVYYDIESHHG